MSELSKYEESAIQQFIGFRYGKQNYGVEGLADEMGLTKTEWKVIRESVNNPLDKTDTKNLDKYFGAL